MMIQENIHKHLNRRNLTGLVLFGLAKKLVWVLILFSPTLFAQKENKFIRKGNSNYYESNYKDAEVDYMKALEKSPESPKGQYNLGTALYKQENYEDATKLFSSVGGSNLEDAEKAEALFNMGNAYMKAQKYPEAVESYKSSLRINPDDMDTKYNLEYARQMMEQQQQDQQNQENQDEQDKQDEQEQEQDQQQDQQEQEQNQDQQQQDQQQQNQDQSQQQNQQQPQPQQISKQDAERMLEALKNDENKTLEKVKLQQVPAKSKSTEKDW